MKRLIFGLLAIVLAAGAAAFTTPANNAGNLVDAYFQFDSDNYLPAIANVQDESKWVRVLDMNDCPSGSARACKIRVTDAHYSGTTLSSSADIQAAESASGVAYVSSAQAQQIVNRANP